MSGEAKTVPVPPAEDRPSSEQVLTRLDLIAESIERSNAQVHERIGVVANDVAGLRREVGGIKSQVQTVVTDQARAVTRMNRLEQAQRPVDEAMKSHHEIELGFREDLRRIESTVLLRLEQQDANAKAMADQLRLETETREAAKRAEAEARAAATAEERRRESLAAKRVEADRTHREKMMAARTPAIVALIGLLGIIASTAGTYYAAKAAHRDTDAKVDNANAKVDRLSSQVTAALSAEPAAAPSAPPPAAAAPAKK